MKSLVRAGTFTMGSRTVHRFGYGAMQLAGPGVFGPPKDRDGAIAVLREFRDVRCGRLPALPSLELFQEMMSFSLGQQVPPEYAPMMREDMLWDAQATPQLGASGRDFRVVVPLLMQLWMFLTPAIYDQAGKTVSPTTEAVLLANPVQAVVTNFRAAVLGTPFDWPGLAVAAAAGVILFAAGAVYFRRTERAFADVI